MPLHAQSETRHERANARQVLLRLATILVFATLTLCLSGCATWYSLTNQPEEPTSSLPKPKSSPDTVAIETIFLRLTAEDDLRWGEVWARIDEQSLDIELRRRLDQNGIRGGVINGELPLVVDHWVEKAAQAIKTDVLEQASIAADVSTHVQTLRCRTGKRKELAVRSKRDGSIVLLHSDGKLARGQEFAEPTMLFDVRTTPNFDGSARIRLLPEIQYGPLLPVYLGGDMAFRREMRRKSKSWEELAVSVNLTPSQTLLLTSTDPPRGLGEHFFYSETAEKKQDRIVLLLRMVSTQVDPLFDPDSVEAATKAAESN
jgi:hypothetical protein